MLTQPCSRCCRGKADRTRHSVMRDSAPHREVVNRCLAQAPQICKLRCSQGMGPPLNSCCQVAVLKRRTDPLVLTHGFSLVLGSLMRPQSDGVLKPRPIGRR